MVEREERKREEKENEGSVPIFEAKTKCSK